MSTSKIASKLVAALKDIDAVEKKGRNQQQGYNYVRSADVANEVRKSLATAGIAFSYSVLSERTWESTTKSGSVQFFCSLMVEVTFTDAESGESISTQCIGWGADSQEKAPYKAMTGALKYALRMNFLIPDESDPEEAEAHESLPRFAPLLGPPPQRQQVVPQQQAPRPQQQSGPVGTITEPQSKRFFAIAKQGGKSDDDIRRYLLNVCKCEKSLQMPKSKYDAACKWAESVFEQPQDDGAPPNYFDQEDPEIPF
jgi:hypothetical protein